MTFFNYWKSQKYLAPINHNAYYHSGAKGVVKTGKLQHLTLHPDETVRLTQYRTIFVIPTIIDDNGDTEGFGVVTLEANACETPVIASKVGGIIDVIEDGYNGFFVEQKNPEQIAARIKQLADNQKLRYSIGKNGRSRVTKEFNWENVADEIIQKYNKLV